MTPQRARRGVHHPQRLQQGGGAGRRRGRGPGRLADRRGPPAPARVDSPSLRERPALVRRHPRLQRGRAGCPGTSTRSSAYFDGRASPTRSWSSTTARPTARPSVGAGVAATPSRGAAPALSRQSGQGRGRAPRDARRDRRPPALRRRRRRDADRASSSAWRPRWRAGADIAIGSRVPLGPGVACARGRTAWPPDASSTGWSRALGLRGRRGLAVRLQGVHRGGRGRDCSARLRHRGFALRRGAAAAGPGAGYRGSWRSR